MLATQSSYCEQALYYQCFESIITYNNTRYTYWVSRTGVAQRRWSDNKKTGHNCDSNERKLQRDGGLITDRTILPVRGLRFGDLGDAQERGTIVPEIVRSGSRSAEM